MSRGLKMSKHLSSWSHLHHPCQGMLIPSESNKLLWNAKQHLKISLATLVEWILIPDFRILHLYFKIPKVHSTSLCMISDHSKKMSLQLQVSLNLQIEIGHFKQPCSKIVYVLRCVTYGKSLFSKYSNDFKVTFSPDLLFFASFKNLTNLTFIFSF